MGVSTFKNSMDFRPIDHLRPRTRPADRRPRGEEPGGPNQKNPPAKWALPYPWRFLLHLGLWGYSFLAIFLEPTTCSWWISHGICWWNRGIWMWSLIEKMPHSSIKATMDDTNVRGPVPPGSHFPWSWPQATPAGWTGSTSSTGSTEHVNASSTRWCSPVIKWFIIPMKTIDISW